MVKRNCMGKQSILINKASENKIKKNQKNIEQS